MDSLSKDHVVCRVARMMTWLVVLLLVTWGAAADGEEPDARTALFEDRVAPVLIRRCVGCHNASMKSGGLDLSRRDTALAGGDSGAVLEPGDAASSYLLDLLELHAMPPPGKGAAVTPEELASLTRWVDQGCPWPAGRHLSEFEFTTESRSGTDWWSFQPIRRPPVPDQQHPSGSNNAIDAFVVRRLAAAGLSPSPEAGRRTLIRRVAFDLTGLPPTPEEIETFLADPAPHAYSTMVDRYLASPHYGERWGRHWLDVVRFSESDGFEEDALRDNAWRYRDYVIESLNADRPFDEFVRQQIAGDVLEPLTDQGVIASGFLVAGPWDAVQRVSPSATIRLQSREDQLEEIVTAVSQTFLGLTVQCARCHNHKFDPIPQTDYYRLSAVFAGVDHGLQPRVHGTRSLMRDDGQVAYTGDRFQPGPRRLHERGNIHFPTEVISPGSLSLTGAPSGRFDLAPDAPEAERRIQFAHWLTSPDHPLLARVMANRVWQHHFGQGLVAAASDFGFHGGRPSHPELLDWLASEFIESGWSVKGLHRIILTSATYRQVSRGGPEADVDAENRLLWRFPPRRLEAETIRDAMLAVSGELNAQLGGPSFRPFNVTRNNTYFYHLSDRGTPEFNRRSVYRMCVQTGMDPLLESLDCPAPGTMAPVRQQTVTALQALNLMNDSFVLRQADRLAERLQREQPDSLDDQVQAAYSRCLGRRPTECELHRAVEHVQDHGLPELCWVLLNSSEFLYVRDSPGGRR